MFSLKVGYGENTLLIIIWNGEMQINVHWILLLQTVHQMFEKQKSRALRQEHDVF
jgi:hypothetical protein